MGKFKLTRFLTTGNKYFISAKRLSSHLCSIPPPLRKGLGTKLIMQHRHSSTATQLNARCVSVSCYNGTAFTALRSEGVTLQFSAPHTLQQNGERVQRINTDRTSTHPTLPKRANAITGTTPFRGISTRILSKHTFVSLVSCSYAADATHRQTANLNSNYCSFSALWMSPR